MLEFYRESHLRDTICGTIYYRSNLNIVQIQTFIFRFDITDTF